jgi:hypothetical protein
VLIDCWNLTYRNCFNAFGELLKKTEMMKKRHKEKWKRQRWLKGKNEKVGRYKEERKKQINRREKRKNKAFCFST